MQAFRFLCAGLVALLAVFAMPVRALDPARAVSQYGHTAWLLRDGALPGPAYPIAQSADGYLWIGTQAGLVRFDGVRFVPLDTLVDTPLPDRFVTALRATRDGALWIGMRTGVARLADGALTMVPEATYGAAAFLEDRDGALWFTAVGVRGNATPVCRVAGGSTQCFGAPDGLDVAAMGCCLGGMAQTAEGEYVIAADLTMLRWRPGGQSRAIASVPKAKSGVQGTMILSASSDTWVGIDGRGAGLGLLRLAGDALEQHVTPQLDGSTLSVQALLVDREGSLWIGTLDDGIWRVRGEKVEHFRTTDGLSSDSIYWFFEDREGSLWVSTSEGIDRFRDTTVTTYGRREGMSVDEVSSVAASPDGTIWAGTAEALDVLRDGAVSSFRAGAGLPGDQVASIMPDHAGRLWVGVDNRLTILADGKFTTVNGVDGGPIGFVTSLAEDSEHNVWAKVSKKLVRITGDVAREDVASPGGVVAADPVEGLWFGQADGEISRIRGGKFEAIPGEKRKGRFVQVLPGGPDGMVFASGDAGLLVVKDGRRAWLSKANGLPCDATYALVFDRDGALWILGQCGLLSIDAAQLRAWWAQPERGVVPRVFDALDGARPGRSPFKAAALGADGRLWFANGIILQSIDPRARERVAAAPPVRIEEVVADAARHPPLDGLSLPPNPRDVRIDYTGFVLAQPQKIGFRYRLEGRGEAWEDAGTRRQALYTDLPPGDYRFEVASRLGDGAWNEQPASLRFSIAPAWYQTVAFRAALVLAVVALLFAAYRWRLDREARDLARRFDERLAERTRLAHELHDTLLQTLQGSKLVADAALDVDTGHDEMRSKMGRISSWLGRAIGEGRAALSAMHGHIVTDDDLAEAFRRAAADCVAAEHVDVALRVDGTPRDLHPIVRDEIFRIGYEAIRNACAHAGGTRVEVTLAYARDFTLRVRDDGRGFDVATAPKEHHFGLGGMRERARRIGARFDIASAAASGTEVCLVVPGRAAWR